MFLNASRLAPRLRRDEFLQEANTQESFTISYTDLDKDVSLKIGGRSALFSNALLFTRGHSYSSGGAAKLASAKHQKFQNRRALRVVFQCMFVRITRAQSSGGTGQ